MRTCNRCGKTQCLTAYNNKTVGPNGKSLRCKTCTREESRTYRIDHRDELNTYRRKWGKENPEKRQSAEAPFAYQMTVRAKVRIAVKTGKLTRKPCVKCGAAKVEAHHADYSKPLDVMWMCKKHHMALHRQQREGGGRYGTDHSGFLLD